ncbi:hypothetical protein [Bradyrhizobium sp. LHD-71]|uniref:hypothetical protein n=1 Tax=Bradyrhizobium sp. LHD-71 TaxID=3072141 RepID=UPI00280F0AFE|nr:hypothetical protein [Bradyrhizobium sp. LHD-71]MDQ8731076.1 hypothetical protein [Bradyrhizobium sp. LHD-71]
MKYAYPIVVVAACLASLGIAVAQDLPQAVTDLRLTDIQIREKPRAEYGRNVHGTLPGGSRVEIDLDRNGVIKEIESRGDRLFPVATIKSLIPAPVTKNASWPADARLEKIEFESAGRIEIEGRLSDGRKFDAEFAADGLMIDFDTDS